MNVRFNDKDVPEYGPNSQPCSANSKVYDAVAFDGKYTCNCFDGFGGDNCELPVCPEGKVCDDTLTTCRAEEVVANGKCSECLYNWMPNADQTACVIKECELLEDANSCTCQLFNLTNIDTVTVNVACDGTDWAKAIALPRYVSQLTLTSIEPDELPALLQRVSVESQQTDTIGDTPPPLSGNSYTADVSSTIDSVIVAKESLVVNNNDNVNASAASTTNAENVDGTNATAATSRAIAPLPECSMGGFVPATDFNIPVGICNSKDGNYNMHIYDASCGTVCPAGDF